MQGSAERQHGPLRHGIQVLFCELLSDGARIFAMPLFQDQQIGQFELVPSPGSSTLQKRIALSQETIPFSPCAHRSEGRWYYSEMSFALEAALPNVFLSHSPAREANMCVGHIFATGPATPFCLLGKPCTPGKKQCNAHHVLELPRLTNDFSLYQEGCRCTFISEMNDDFAGDGRGLELEGEAAATHITITLGHPTFSSSEATHAARCELGCTVRQADWLPIAGTCPCLPGDDRCPHRSSTPQRLQRNGGLGFENFVVKEVPYNKHKGAQHVAFLLNVHTSTSG